jgi:hypothetical protein
MNEVQHLEPSPAVTSGGIFTLSTNIQIRLAWYIRLWRWLRRRPTFDVITAKTEPIPFKATAEEIQAAIEAVEPKLKGVVIINATEREKI